MERNGDGAGIYHFTKEDVYIYAHESMLHYCGEKQTKTKVRVNRTPIGIAKINKDNIKCR